MKTTLAYAYATASATSLCLLCCICNGLSNLCIGKSLLFLPGHNFDALPPRNLRPTRRTVVPVTRSTTGVLATHHTDTVTENLCKMGNCHSRGLASVLIRRLGLGFSKQIAP
jgi:hypothetical protein